MIQIKNFLIKREQSQARLSFAKREKSRLLAKLILTLVALLAVTTGAWADETLLLTIESKDNTSFKSGSMTFDDMVTVTFSKSVYNIGNNSGWFTGSTASLLTVAGINGYTITSCKFYTENGDAADGYTVQGESPSVYLYNTSVFTDDSQSEYIGYSGVTKIEVYGTAPSASSATAVDIDWNAATKTGTFTQPAGNVTVSVEYFPQATMTSDAVTAATGVKATTDDPLVTLDAAKLTGATKLMYYVSTEATTPAYDAEGWTDEVPTAEKFTQAGSVNVWYYPVGTVDDDPAKTYSDGDICATALTVTLDAAPTYDITFAEGTEESDKWKAEPNADVKKGQTVTVTYSGTKKVIGVKAEKKAKVVSLIVNPEVGQIIGSDGKNYDANATLPDGVTKVAKICYVGSETGEAAPYNHGLALALSDANGGNGCKWNTENTDAGHTKHTSSTFTEESGLQYNDATHNSDTYPAFKAAIANNGTAAPTGCSSWFLASGYQWQKMIDAVGLANLGLTDSAYYWSSSENDPDHAWDFEYTQGGSWSNSSKDYHDLVRACIAF